MDAYYFIITILHIDIVGWKLREDIMTIIAT